MGNEIKRVVICGKIRSGKDTVAKVFIDSGFKRFYFAAGIERVVALLYPEEFAKGKPRRHLQGVGQGLRAFDPSVWINYTFKQIEASGAERVVVTDLRQPNELAALRAAGFFVIRVEARKDIRIERARSSGDTFDPADFEHETEQYIDGLDVDLEIKNDGTLEELITAANVAMHTRRGRLEDGERLRA